MLNRRLPGWLRRVGSAARFNVGVLAGNLVQLDSAAKLPAVDGSQLTGLASSFAAGTVMVFKQTAAPTGWTKDTTAGLDNSAIRITTGTVGSGGSSGFNTVFGITNTDTFTLSSTHVPGLAHTHGGMVPQDWSCLNPTNASHPLVGLGTSTAGTQTGSATLGGGSAHSHPLDLRVKYNDCIYASKN